MADMITLFQETSPSLDSYWRSVILFGRNVATYKLGLAKSLHEIAPTSGGSVTLADLAEPFSRHLCEHLAHSPKQVTSSGSKFLDACRAYNDGTLPREKLLETTVKLGFNNVIDAFHIVNQAELPRKFFVSEGKGQSRRIILTDQLFELLELPFADDLARETESRWRLVETAWEQNIAAALLDVHYDMKGELLYVETRKNRRKTVTSARAALNGYQKGKCFYCFGDISIGATGDGEEAQPSAYHMSDSGLLLKVSDETPIFANAPIAPHTHSKLASDATCDVDHFFPHTLKSLGPEDNLDGIWNLVLSCKDCNRGEGGKSARIPAPKYLERLHTRNEFLISSHHPLRETLINQTGRTPEERLTFLNDMNKFAIDHLIHTWETKEKQEASF